MCALVPDTLSDWLMERSRKKAFESVRFPEFPCPVPRAVPRVAPELPLHRAAREAREALALRNLAVVSIPAPGSGFEFLLGSAQDVLVPVSAPAPEAIALQQTVAPSVV